MVDLLILIPTNLIIQSLVGQNPFTILNIESLSELQQLQTNNSILPGIILYIFNFGFMMLMWVNYDGATPGKKLMEIKIVKTNGSKINSLTGFIRSMINYNISMIILCLGYIRVIWDKKN